MPDVTSTPGFWSRVWSFIKAGVGKIFTLFLRYPMATIFTIVLVVIAIFLYAYGKTFQIGGLLGKIWGTDLNKNKQIARETVPVDRIDDAGKPIQPGDSDTGGYVQAPVSTEIKDPGILSNPTVVTIIDPERGEITIPLPTGVKNGDVKEVIRVSPTVYEVKCNDGGVSTHTLDNLIGKLDI